MQYLEIKPYLEFLDKLPNINIAIIEGNYSEPTLYPHLPELIKYLKSRNIRLRLSTNGDTKNLDYWKKLGSLVTSNDVVRFSVDGSNQEIYGKYRVGGNLQRVLENHRALRENSEVVTVCQNIVFDYNLSDRENMKKLFFDHGFTYLSFLKCYITDVPHPVYKAVPEIEKYYEVQRRCLTALDELSLRCDSYVRNEIYVNHKGQVFLCGTLEEAAVYDDKPFITDDLEKIFADVTKTANDIYNNPICKSDCNMFCYSLGEKYPDLLYGRDGSVTKMNYFTKEVKDDQCTIHQLI
jgi:MoaA/NifB/PqqE/SkfB family radical SAM enzyme